MPEVAHRLSELKAQTLKSSRECLGCRKTRGKGEEVLITPLYRNGSKMSFSIFCNEECFAEYDYRHWTRIAIRNQGHYKVNFN